jgi:transcriptional regulator with XRE-family HTH domain
MSILPSQCHAARALINMGLAELARRAAVGRDTIADLENGSRTLSPGNLAAIRAALEKAGVIFIDENGEVRASGSEKSTGFETLASCADGLAKASKRPEARVQDRPYERAERAQKRSLVKAWVEMAGNQRLSSKITPPR